MDTRKPSILILCTGNSCRSQMAEGWFREMGNGTIEVYSAGVEKHGVNPTAIEVMKESGVDISSHTSNHIDEFESVDFDFVITVCDHAREKCPVFTGPAKKFHRNFEDPAGAGGSREEKLQVFRKVRDEIRNYAEEFIAEKLR